MSATNGSYKSLRHGEEISIEDYTSLPESSIHALLQRGMSHYFGNEVSTRVSALAKSRQDKGETFSDVEKAVAKHDFTQSAWKALTEGTVGANIRGPRGTAVETDMKKFAEAEVRAILKAHGLSFPGGTNLVTFPDGQTMDAKTLVERRLASHGDRLRAKAEAEAAARERLAAQTKGGGDGTASVEALGL